ncbi:MAG: hypothetical protein HQL98_06245 [Magnetococcales bacterium]|nr:hypothetical protein [Magnetococcales bacterium]
MGMVFLVVILVSALPQLATQEPVEAETRRLKSLNAELTAKLQVREGRIQGLIQGDSQGAGRLEDWETTPPSSRAAEWTGVALLRGEVADLTARNAAMLKQWKGDKNAASPPVLAEAEQEGQTARIDRLQTEIARLNTRIEEATRETGEARRLRVELEARLQERENRIVQMGHDLNALTSRNGGATLPVAAPPAATSEPQQRPLSDEVTRLNRELERLKQENATLKWIGSAPAPGSSPTGDAHHPSPPLPRQPTIKP